MRPLSQRLFACCWESKYVDKRSFFLTYSLILSFLPCMLSGVRRLVCVVVVVSLRPRLHPAPQEVVHQPAAVERRPRLPRQGHRP